MTSNIYLLLSMSCKTWKYIINHEKLLFQKNGLNAVLFPLHYLLWVPELLPSWPTRLWAEKGIWDLVPGRSPMGWAVGPPEGVTDIWPVCLSQGRGTLLKSVSERAPESVIGSWGLQSIYGMPTSNGLAKAYKYVTTQAIVSQKHTTLPRVPERIRRNYSRDKRKRHRSSETLCPMYKCFPYAAQEDGKSYTLRYQRALPSELSCVWKQWCSRVMDQGPTYWRGCHGATEQWNILWFTQSGGFVQTT